MACSVISIRINVLATADIIVFIFIDWFLKRYYSVSTTRDDTFNPSTASVGVLNKLKTARLTRIQAWIFPLSSFLSTLLHYYFTLVCFQSARLISYKLFCNQLSVVNVWYFVLCDATWNSLVFFCLLLVSSWDINIVLTAS